MSKHNAGLVEGYTAVRRPVELIYSEAHLRYDEAVAAERRIKGWSRAKEIAVVRNDFEALQKFAERQSSMTGNTPYPHAEETRRVVSKHGPDVSPEPFFETPADAGSSG